MADIEEQRSGTQQFTNGQALEVRLDAAYRLLDIERDREQSMNNRAIAVGVAAAVLMGIAARPIESTFEHHHDMVARILLGAAAGLSVAACLTTLAVIVTGVLRPSPRGGFPNKTLEEWFEPEPMKDAEQTARFELLHATVQTVLSMRAMNKEKADRLGFAYWLLLTQPLAIVPLLASLLAT